MRSLPVLSAVALTAVELALWLASLAAPEALSGYASLPYGPLRERFGRVPAAAWAPALGLALGALVAAADRLQAWVGPLIPRRGSRRRSEFLDGFLALLLMLIGLSRFFDPQEFWVILVLMSPRLGAALLLARLLTVSDEKSDNR